MSEQKIRPTPGRPTSGRRWAAEMDPTAPSIHANEVDVDECQTCGYQPATDQDVALHIHCDKCGALYLLGEEHEADLHKGIQPAGEATK